MEKVGSNPIDNLAIDNLAFQIVGRRSSVVGRRLSIFHETYLALLA
jgi:hypothetical protein